MADTAHPVKLIRLAPEPERTEEGALRYSEHLADLLATDDGLPAAMRRSEGTPRLSASDFLTFTQSWCREKSALSFALVDASDTAVGMITLSHINAEAGTARTGIMLASRLSGRGIPVDALSQLLSLARSLGIRRVGGDIPEADRAPVQTWDSIGVSVSFEVGEMMASIR